MKVVSFNTNGIRARLHQLEALIHTHQPDIIGIQETKVIDENFPIQAIEKLGYHAYFYGQKSHYGVALLSKHPLNHITKGLPQESEEAQRRMIAGQISLPNNKTLTILNGYFPQGESCHHDTKFPYKRQFYKNLIDHLHQHFSPHDLLIVMGDFNICPNDIDIGIGEQNAKRWLKTGACSFLPEEREWYQTIQTWGLDDSYRKHYHDSTEFYSWFDYRSRGFEREPRRGLRIDHILATSPALEYCVDAGIDYAIRSMEKPSDHCPIWAEFNF
ncbi:Exodeoxyribonuclease III [Piscirickettsia salmonis]|uniref:Exodeoxyribonuclease III n=1 Tax=Piscirickettsia salmonis TaxID=1238 RepID=A0A1L6TB36_PISSA|nr:exodeoxyribonuclease III [Piscirickettsia salmonis]AKP73622.1 exodeoxyribonuclease III [Piscirickettsia salmonis LF-89 = ATCC VR-1361]ALB22393.1 exodeoxyribonuclease III [Piscirickettsia salmonis]ALY02467.1 exodeoxyribonuclease III [Piscirickettsia salmonis]AMA41986.1 exodeoxyribonuclease III [Piscirickettsia salmonis]AOS34458.1 exodeoxyribonuclease III [Piscirickettsia salmonis]